MYVKTFLLCVMVTFYVFVTKTWAEIDLIGKIRTCDSVWLEIIETESEILNKSYYISAFSDGQFSIYIMKVKP